MKSREEAIEIIEKLKEYYPDCRCSLDFTTPFEMLVSVMLSAQCTDERVNKVTPILFEKYNSAEKMSQIDLEELEDLIHSCGFYKNKAKNLKSCGQALVSKYNGNVPEDIELLQQLPGIGRKCANVIMLEAFNHPMGIAVDTHAKRISNKVGLSEEQVPEKIERDLLKVIPKKYYYDVNHLFVWHGRNICNARNPACEKCPINLYCEQYKKNLHIEE